LCCAGLSHRIARTTKYVRSAVHHPICVSAWQAWSPLPHLVTLDWRLRTRSARLAVGQTEVHPPRREGPGRLLPQTRCDVQRWRTDCRPFNSDRLTTDQTVGGSNPSGRAFHITAYAGGSRLNPSGHETHRASMLKNFCQAIKGTLIPSKGQNCVKLSSLQL